MLYEVIRWIIMFPLEIWSAQEIPKSDHCAVERRKQHDRGVNKTGFLHIRLICQMNALLTVQPCSRK